MSDALKIIKTESKFYTILFVALTPDVEDRNGDTITEEEITKTAYEFLLNLSDKKVNVDHEDDTEIETAKYVESFIAPVNIIVGEEVIPRGSWVVGIQFDPDTYQKVVDGDYVGISIQGIGYYETKDE